MTAHRRKRVATGIYKDRGGLAATVAVGSGVDRLQSERRFDRTESLRVIKEWQDRERARLRELRPHVGRVGFDGDIRRYLKVLADRPNLQAERARQLAWWADRRVADGTRLGARRRHTFKPHELQTALADLTTAGAAPSTVRHYRTALFHLYTVLDGKDAPNPLRNVLAPRSADAEPRALTYDLIEAIFATMPDRGQGLKQQPRSEVSKTKARLRVLAYVGLPHAQVMKLKPEDVDWADASVLVGGRHKGRGSRTTRLPLTSQGVAALRQFFAAGATGRFSQSSVRNSFWRAIHVVVDGLAAVDWRAARDLLRSLERMKARPYDLRHSFLTQAQLASGNIRATQGLALHADGRQTTRYTLAAVAPELRAAADKLAARMTAQQTKRAADADGT